jgi:hypothetical protein
MANVVETILKLQGARAFVKDADGVAFRRGHWR